MSDLEPVSGELVEVEHTPPNLFGSDDPRRTLEKAGAVAAALADVIKAKKLVTTIKGRDHVLVEGWTLLGTLVGVFPVCVWTRKLENGWEARVEARTLAGAIVGAAEAECLRSESTWSSRDDYALRSMAQTRATSKALRQPLGFIVSLAGYDPTPAEEAEVKRAKPAPARVQQIAAPADDGSPVTEAQMKQLHKLAHNLGWDDQERHYNAQVESFKDLTRAKAKALLSEWQFLSNQRAKEQARGIKPAEPPTDEPYVCWVTNEHGEKCINHRPHDSDHMFEIPIKTRDSAGGGSGTVSPDKSEPHGPEASTSVGASGPSTLGV